MNRVSSYNWRFVKCGLSIRLPFLAVFQPVASDSKFLSLAVLLVFSLSACVGFQGRVYQRLPDNTIGPRIAGAALKFIKEDGSVTKTTVSDASGSYKIDLSAGRYRVMATHLDYEDYSSAPGFFVVTGSDGYQTGNFFLREPRVSTVLVVHHADRVVGVDVLLEPLGTDRADKLAEVAANAGVTAIYSTNYNRTVDTAQPLADALGLDIIPYTTYQAVANMINNDHPGDVVLVVGHSNTTTAIVDEVLGQGLYPVYPNNPHTDDYDNLFVIGKPVGGEPGSVLNLQYGADTTPDTPNLSRANLTTVLLLRHAETAQPLANTLGQNISAYNTANLAGLVNGIFQDHVGDTVLVLGDNVTLKGIITQFGGSPYPAVFTNEYDHMVVMFAIGSSAGNARLISLQYGTASP